MGASTHRPRSGQRAARAPHPAAATSHVPQMTRQYATPYLEFAQTRCVHQVVSTTSPSLQTHGRSIHNGEKSKWWWILRVHHHHDWALLSAAIHPSSSTRGLPWFPGLPREPGNLDLCLVSKRQSILKHPTSPVQQCLRTTALEVASTSVLNPRHLRCCLAQHTAVLQVSNNAYGQRWLQKNPRPRKRKVLCGRPTARQKRAGSIHADRHPGSIRALPQ